jgi:hypothetical protein
MLASNAFANEFPAGLHFLMDKTFQKRFSNQKYGHIELE